MRTNKILLKIFYTGLFLIGNIAISQQDSQFTQYMYNPVNINPAYAGTREVMSIFAMHRSQWVGLEGAPVTNTASMHTPIKNTNLGIGLSFINEEIGPSDENAISIDLSYIIQTSDSYKLSLGLKATANLMNVDFTKLTQQLGDPELQYNIENRFTPNIGSGIFFYSDKTYLGLSVPNIFENKYYDGESTFIAKERMHFYFVSGHIFDLNNTLKFKPSILVKAVNHAPLQVDISANFLINEKFTIGAAYRWSASLSALIGFQVTDGLLVGYAYDTETTNLDNYNSGSHEIFLRFELSRKFNKIISPRFF